jgi:hypothetical protein
MLLGTQKQETNVFYLGVQQEGDGQFTTNPPLPL